MDTVIIRADASPDIGAGHQMRCLALAQAIGELGGRAVFAAARTLPQVRQRIADEGIALIDLQATPGSLADAEESAAVAADFRADWVVADGYRFDAEFQSQVKAAGLKLLIVDDVAGCSHYYSDIIVNQNISAPSLDYSAREAYTDLRLGTRFALLRQEFLRPPRADASCPAEASNVLVTLGGGGTSAAIETLVDALVECGIVELRAVILLSGSHPSLPDLREKAKALHAVFVTDSTRLAEHMRWAHMAVSAGGGTTWELAYFGVPMLVVVAAENQRPSAEDLSARQAAVSLGGAHELSVPATAHALRELSRDAPRRQRMTQRLRDMVDGRGARRVAAQLLNAASKNTPFQETA